MGITGVEPRQQEMEEKKIRHRPDREVFALAFFFLAGAPADLTACPRHPRPIKELAFTFLMVLGYPIFWFFFLLVGFSVVFSRRFLCFSFSLYFLFIIYIFSLYLYFI
jgi:hypothetical protein